MTWTLEHIEKLKAQGKIRGYAIQQPKVIHEATKGKIVSKHFAKRSKEKNWIGWNLLVWCQERSLQLQEEYRFDDARRWKADYAIPEWKVLIEYEGIFSDKSRHTTAKGFTGDAEKYNQAQSLGWAVLRFTAINYKTMLTALRKFSK